MKNAKSFLGYSRLSAEITAGAIDHREQIDLSTEHPVPEPGAPLHHNLVAPNQWPSDEVLPTFRPVFTDCMSPPNFAAGGKVREVTYTHS